MISQFSRPEEIDREFWLDYPKAMYWLKKKNGSREQRIKMIKDGFAVLDYLKEYSFSDPVFYTSQQTGNQWMSWICSKRDAKGGVHFYMRSTLFLYTAAYMTMMLPMKMGEESEEGEIRNERNTINVYTSHMFQRMADPDRLGVDMSDRVRVMRNFTEFVATGYSDIRPPRDGERDTQVLLRTPASWIRGHMTEIESRRVLIYRTFWTDRSMSYRQLKDVRSFAKFADERMSKR